ncbi:alpha/beta hydrolase [Marinomonas agarivorans]|nr:alpha/beta hydrolase [Marinomonas agarivorans]
MFTTLSFTTTNTHLAYRLYENPAAEQGRTLVLLHGAGVGGLLTWGDFMPHLQHWRRVVIPDLKGMGDSYGLNRAETATSIAELSEDIVQLLVTLQLEDFDLVGYSLGGLVSLMVNAHLKQEERKQKERKQETLPPNTATPLKLSSPQVKKMALLEPAGLDRQALTDLIALRSRYKEAAHTIRATGDVEQGIAHFVDSVAPNRRKHPVAEATTQSRLAHRPLGFAYALDAVTDFVESHQQQVDIRTELLSAAPPTLLFAGELSHALLQDYHGLLATSYEGWHSEVIKGTDHSLPFQKPRQIAKKLNNWFA